MRVLDVGCGAGDVTLLISELVGGDGHVVGIDRAPAALAAAEQRAKSHAVRNVSFHEGAPGSLSFEAPFDAIAGRYILMFQADPATMLRSAIRHLKPGGVVAFHEPDWAGGRSNPPAPSYDQCCRWIIETFRRAGIETHMGDKLDATFRAAGLAAPQMHLESIIGGVNGGVDWVHQTYELLVSMCPEATARGVTSELEIMLSGLEQRMHHEVEAGSVIVGRAEVGAWSRLPPQPH
jgi:SAM-dependent methyltransferase